MYAFVTNYINILKLEHGSLTTDLFNNLPIANPKCAVTDRSTPKNIKGTENVPPPERAVTSLLHLTFIVSTIVCLESLALGMTAHSSGPYNDTKITHR